MEITKVHELIFTKEDRIMTTSLSSLSELVVLMSSGSVVSYNIETQKGQYLFSVNRKTSFEDGGFDVEAPSTIYTLDDIIVIVNDYKLHGFVHYPNKYKSLHLWRADYHADISFFPLALFKNEQGIPHLIYGKAWNHVQIMNLDTRQILTASKSLIEEDAEERHLEYYKIYEENVKLPWPRPYDYFYGKLQMSPNQQFFLSQGWVWGSFDSYNIYEVDHFINSNRIADKNLGNWEHSGRGACWIDDETIAITYNPYEEEYEDSVIEAPDEIHFYKIDDQEPQIIKRVKVTNLRIVNAEIAFNKALNVLVLTSKTIGIAVLSLEGEVIFHTPDLYPDVYDSVLNRFIKIEGKSILIYQINRK